MGSVRVSDLDEDNLDDVFGVCSCHKLGDPLQQHGIALKKRWLREMLGMYGSLTKIAYLEDKPVVQILFYPEDIVPFIGNPRRGAIVLHCVYNPFPEARGKGAATALLRSLIDECKTGLRCLKGRPCRFVTAKPFTTGEGIPLEEFYAAKDFKKAPNEMFLEVSAPYQPRRVREYKPLPEDLGRAITFYNPICEWSYPFAVRVRELLNEIEPSLHVELIYEWRHPQESMKRGNQGLVVNATPIKSFWTQKEAFRSEVEQAMNK